MLAEDFEINSEWRLQSLLDEGDAFAFQETGRMESGPLPPRTSLLDSLPSASSMRRPRQSTLARLGVVRLLVKAD